MRPERTDYGYIIQLVEYELAKFVAVDSSSTIPSLPYIMEKHMKRKEPKYRLKRKTYSNEEIEKLAELSVAWHARMRIYDDTGRRVMLLEPR